MPSKNYGYASTDPEKDITLNSEVSPYVIREARSHIMEDGTEQPIRYASRALAIAGKWYSQLDKEGLAKILVPVPLGYDFYHSL